MRLAIYSDELGFLQEDGSWSHDHEDYWTSDDRRAALTQRMSAVSAAKQEGDEPGITNIVDLDNDMMIAWGAKTGWKTYSDIDYKTA